MSLPFTEEMNNLYAKIEPYLVPAVGPKFKDNTPEYIIEMHKEFVRLREEQQNKWIREMFEDVNN